MLPSSILKISTKYCLKKSCISVSVFHFKICHWLKNANQVPLLLKQLMLDSTPHKIIKFCCRPITPNILSLSIHRAKMDILNSTGNNSSVIPSNKTGDHSKHYKRCKLSNRPGNWENRTGTFLTNSSCLAVASRFHRTNWFRLWTQEKHLRPVVYSFSVTKQNDSQCDVKLNPL